MKKKKKPSLWVRIQKIPHAFAKLVILHCIGVVTVAAYYSLYAQRNGAEMVALFKAIGYFFITELAFLFGKTIWEKKWSRDKQQKQEDQDDEIGIDQQDL